MKNTLLLLSGIVLVFFPACSGAPETSPADQAIQSVSRLTGEEVLLRIKPAVGDTQKMQMIMEMDSEGTPQMSSVLTANVTLEVTHRDADMFTFSLQYNSLKFTTDTGGISFSYDSEAESQEGMAAMFDSQIRSFIDKPLRMKMNEMGQVTEFALPGQSTSEQFGDMASMAIPLPRDPVGVGDTWTADRTADGIGLLKMDMTLDKITVDDVIIKTHGVIEGKDEAGRGEFTGEYRIDRNSGLTKEGLMDMETAIENNPVKMKLKFKSM